MRANLDKDPMVLGLKRPDFTTSNRIAEAMKSGVKVNACQNTMNGMKLTFTP